MIMLAIGRGEHSGEVVRCSGKLVPEPEREVLQEGRVEAGLKPAVHGPLNVLLDVLTCRPPASGDPPEISCISMSCMLFAGIPFRPHRLTQVQLEDWT